MLYTILGPSFVRAHTVRFADDSSWLILRREKTFVKQARVSSWHPNTDLSQGEKLSEGEQETKKNGHHTLGVEKKRSDLKREEKMTNTPVRTVASMPGQKMSTETKKVELNKLYSNTVLTEASHCFSISVIS